MKKKLLFFGYTLDMGGAEKVLIDFLKVLNPHYEIDVALLQAKGALMGDVPEEIEIKQMRNGLLSYILFRFIPFFRKRKINIIANSKDYDVAIGFFEGRSATWVADIKKDIRKIAWVHNDVEYFDIGIKRKEILDSYSKVDTIITVSEHSKKSFSSKYGFPEEKIEVLYNLIDEESISVNANKSVQPNECFTFINVGRMRPQKRQDRLVEIARLLKNENFCFKIQILGNGPEEEKIKQMINEKNVQDVIELKGLVMNPYPYIKQADCVVVSSDFEGYSIAIKEALFLGKVILSTDVSGVKEIFKEDEYGIVAEKSTDDLYKKMKQILKGEIDIKKIEERLKNFDCSNNSIKEKIFTIIEKG